jgi:transmembrane sensor
MTENFHLIEEAIIGYLTGTLTPEQAGELERWIGQDDANRKKLHDLAMIWDETAFIAGEKIRDEGRLRNIRKIISENCSRRLPARMVRLRVSTLVSIAAAILVLVSLGLAGVLYFKRPIPEANRGQFVEAAAPKGSKSLLTLPDGTSVWLNADTKFRYPVDYGITNREVYLEGEAYFKVSKNAALPFKVFTSDITVTALGTAFNVKAYTEESTIETTLEEGSVRIEGIKKKGKALMISQLVLKPKESAIFQRKQGEMVSPVIKDPQPARWPSKKVEPKTTVIQVVQVSDTRLLTSWKDSRWIFKNEKLMVLVPKLERRYDVEIEFADNSLKDYAFNGTLLEESLEQVLNAICFTAPIKYKIDGKKVFLSEDKTMRRNLEKKMNP